MLSNKDIAESTVSQKLNTENDITEELVDTFLFKMLKSQGNFSPVSQHSQSKGDVFGLQGMLDDTPLTRDKLSEQKWDVELKGLR